MNNNNYINIRLSVIKFETYISHDTWTSIFASVTNCSATIETADSRLC